jgi:hypothetical protein
VSELFPLACGLLLGALLAALGMLAARHVRAPHRGRS